MTIPEGPRFEATQALRQILARAVVWQLIDVNPAGRAPIGDVGCRLMRRMCTP
jgi:hypothetical protein